MPRSPQAHIKMAQRVLEAVTKHKHKFSNSSQNRIVIHPAHDIEKGVDGLNAARNETLPDDMAPSEKMERLVQALGRFVDDEPEQLGRGTETVWDVSERLIPLTPGSACATPRAFGSIPSSDPSDIAVPRSKRSAHRLPHHQAQLSYLALG